MSSIILRNVELKTGNPAACSDALTFDITFEAIEALEEDLDWKLVYVGSAENDQQDQELASVLVGPVAIGLNQFQLASETGPDLSRVPQFETGVTALLVSCSYRQQEFVRVGYYVHHFYPDPELQLLPPQPPRFDLLQRSVLTEQPRVTRFPIQWSLNSPVVPAALTAGYQEDAFGLPSEDGRRLDTDAPPPVQPPIGAVVHLDDAPDLAAAADQQVTVTAAAPATTAVAAAATTAAATPVTVPAGGMSTDTASVEGSSAAAVRGLSGAVIDLNADDGIVGDRVDLDDDDDNNEDEDEDDENDEDDDEDDEEEDEDDDDEEDEDEDDDEPGAEIDLDAVDDGDEEGNEDVDEEEDESDTAGADVNAGDDAAAKHDDRLALIDVEAAGSAGKKRRHATTPVRAAENALLDLKSADMPAILSDKTSATEIGDDNKPNGPLKKPKLLNAAEGF